MTIGFVFFDLISLFVASPSEARVGVCKPLEAAAAVALRQNSGIGRRRARFSRNLRTVAAVCVVWLALLSLYWAAVCSPNADCRLQ